MVRLAELRERLPGLVGEQVVAIADGWDSEVHVVDDAWVAGTPRRPQVAEEVRAEIALDFAWLLTGLGARFASELLAAYHGEVDSTFTDRAAFFHLLGLGHEVLYGVDFGLPHYVDSGLAGVRERLR